MGTKNVIIGDTATKFVDDGTGNFVQPVIAAAPSLAGAGTYKLAGSNGLADESLLAALAIGAWPAGFVGSFDIKIVSGPVYMTTDGTAATANAMQWDAGEKREARNSIALANGTHLFVPTGQAYDLRVELYTGGGVQ